MTGIETRDLRLTKADALPTEPHQQLLCEAFICRSQLIILTEVQEVVNTYLTFLIFLRNTFCYFDSCPVLKGTGILEQKKSKGRLEL